MKETLCKLETVVVSLSVSSIKSGRYEDLWAFSTNSGPSYFEGSCTCTGSTPCNWLEQIPRPCHTALLVSHHLPPGNAEPCTLQFSTGICLPALPVISMFIPLPLPPNKHFREWEHPSVLIPSCNVIQTPHSPCNPAPLLELIQRLC